ncbi:hypothetical protein GTY23_26755 [Streptomyces sp. SID5998]|nr:hypothetical protein [Streptomyces sp. SID5998]
MTGTRGALAVSGAGGVCGGAPIGCGVAAVALIGVGGALAVAGTWGRLAVAGTWVRLVVAGT